MSHSNHFLRFSAFNNTFWLKKTKQKKPLPFSSCRLNVQFDSPHQRRTCPTKEMSGLVDLTLQGVSLTHFLQTDSRSVTCKPCNFYSFFLLLTIYNQARHATPTTVGFMLEISSWLVTASSSLQVNVLQGCQFVEGEHVPTRPGARVYACTRSFSGKTDNASTLAQALQIRR
ncbi:hypothetical protein ILYODFUR_005228 [Ilyodon furcidens]|uniref:Uncharacterized protein n=1 Tax=Ilyodon furcidens TaxID=33524 RepID=A0ABV0UFM8_9TELE